jgi:predicted alpha/beta-fold hydrolase
VFTAPLHGFGDTDDYWRRGSAKPHLHAIRIPALAVNALNDPFVPAASLPRPGEVGTHVTLWQPAHGGHVGFPRGRPPGHVRGMPEAVGTWLAQHA